MKEARNHVSPFTPRLTLSRMVGAVFLGLVLPILGSAVLMNHIPAWRWEQYPALSPIEGLGAFIALTLVWTLLLFRKFGTSKPSQFLLACALIGMGLLDGLHAAVVPGQSFVWLNSLATLKKGQPCTSKTDIGAGMALINGLPGQQRPVQTISSLPWHVISPAKRN